MSLYFRPLRNPFGTMQPAAQAAGCFCCTAAGKLAWPTSDNGNRQEVRRTDGGIAPKVARTPAGGPEMPQAQRRGISSWPILSIPSHSVIPFVEMI